MKNSLVVFSTLIGFALNAEAGSTDSRLPIAQKKDVKALNISALTPAEQKEFIKLSKEMSKCKSKILGKEKCKQKYQVRYLVLQAKLANSNEQKPIAHDDYSQYCAGIVGKMENNDPRDQVSAQLKAQLIETHAKCLAAVKLSIANCEKDLDSLLQFKEQSAQKIDQDPSFCANPMGLVAGEQCPVDMTLEKAPERIRSGFETALQMGSEHHALEQHTSLRDAMKKSTQIVNGMIKAKCDLKAGRSRASQTSQAAN